LKRGVLFVHDGGEGAHEADEKLAASLRDVLGSEWDVRCPKMPDEDSPKYEAWKDKIARELAAMDGEAILVGHSLGASVLLKYLSEEEVERPTAGLFLVASPSTGAPRIGKSKSTSCETPLPRSSPKGFKSSYTTAAMMRWFLSRTSLCTKRNSRRRPFAGSVAADTSSATTYLKSPGTSGRL